MSDATAVPRTRRPESRRTEKVGNVVSTKMQKTIVVEVEMRKTHPKYKRVIKISKKFYAHDEQNSARVGDVVRIRESRPLSKLKRWTLEEVIRRSSLPQCRRARAARCLSRIRQSTVPVSGVKTAKRSKWHRRRDEYGSADENHAGGSR